MKDSQHTRPDSMMLPHLHRKVRLGQDIPVEGVGRRAAVAPSLEGTAIAVADQGTNPPEVVRVDELGTNTYQYPLRNPVDLPFDGRAIYFREIALNGQGATRLEALADLGLRLHRTIQKLRRSPPHLRTDEQSRQLHVLATWVDLDEFDRRHPIDEPVIGEVVEVQADLLRIRLLTEPSDEILEVPLNDLPAIAAGFGQGEWFAARIRRFPERIEWLTWVARQRLRDDDSIWDELDATPPPRPEV